MSCFTNKYYYCQPFALEKRQSDVETPNMAYATIVKII